MAPLFGGLVMDLCLFLIYVTASEFNHLFGPGEMRRLLFTRRPSELQLNRGQRIRELSRLSRLADAHSRDELRDPTSPVHDELIDSVRRRQHHLDADRQKCLPVAWP